MKAKMNMKTWNFEKLQEMDSNKQFGLFTLYLCENEKNKNIVTNMYKKFLMRTILKVYIIIYLEIILTTMLLML